MRKGITLLAVLALFGFSVRAQEPMRLSDCIDYALSNHSEIRVAQLSIKDADWQIRENKAIAFPQINLGLNAQHFLIQPALPAEALGFEGAEPGTKLKFALQNTIGGSVSVGQLLYNSSYIASIKGARMYRDYVNLQLNGIREKVRNRVIDAYLPALIVTESIAVLDKNIESEQKLLDDTRATYKAGFVEQLDVDRVEYLLSTLKTQRESLVRQREIVIDALKFAINKPMDQDILPSDDLDRLLTDYGDVDPEEKLDYMNRPDYQVLLKARELSQVQVDAYRKDWLPVVTAFASYDPSYQGNDALFWVPSSIIGVKATMPIFNGGMSKAKQERAVISALKVDEQKNLLTRAYDLEAESARKQYYSTKLKLEDQQHNQDLAERIYKTSEAKFRQGVGSSFEVTQSQLGYYQAQAALINARFDYLNAIIALRKALGKL